MDETIKLSFKNISCASCVKTIESAMNQVGGVKTAQVNFAEKTAQITGTATAESLISAVEAVGYQAKLIDEHHSENEEQEEFIRFRQFIRKFIIAGTVGVVLYLLALLDIIPPLTSLTGQITWFFIGFLTLGLMIYGKRPIIPPKKQTQPMLCHNIAEKG